MDKKPTDPTTITLTTKTRDLLKKNARKDETYDDFIIRLFKEAGYEKHGST